MKLRQCNIIQSTTQIRTGIHLSIISHLNLKPVSRHTSLILVDRRLAFLGGIVGLGEQHAVVSGLLFGFADAAWLGLLERVFCASVFSGLRG